MVAYHVDKVLVCRKSFVEINRNTVKMRFKLLLPALFMGLCFLFVPTTDSYAQCGIPCEEPNGCGGEDSGSPAMSPVYCGNNFGNAVYSNAGAPAAGVTPPNGCIPSIDNPSYIGFIATSTFIDVVVNITSCTGAAGLQIALYDPNGSCTNLAGWSQLDCESLTGNQEAVTISTTSLTVGNSYFIMIDGYGGDICEYTLEVTGNDNAPIIPSPGDITGPISAQVGCTFTYSVPDDLGGVVDYEWTITPPSSATIIGDPTGPSVDIEFTNIPFANIEVIANTICGPSTIPSFITVGIGPSIPGLEVFQTCIGDCIVYEGQQYCGPANTMITLTGASYAGCDSMVQLINVPLPIAVDDIGDQEICSGECIDIGGTNVCDAGAGQVDLETFQGCDSTIVYNIIVLDPQADISASSTSVDCSGNPITLDGSNSTDAQTYSWTNSSGTEIGTGPTVTVTDADTYTLTVETTSASGTTCSDTESITIADAGADPPVPTISGNLDVCQNSTEVYSIINDPEYDDITWTIMPAGTTFGGQGTPSISVDWGAGAMAVSVTVSNDCGSSSDDVTITFNGLPTAPTLSGDTDICGNTSTTTYSVSNDPDLSYNWIVSGAPVTSGQGSNSIDVDWSGTSGGTVSVEVSNSCGSATSNVLNVSVTDLPDSPNSISGDLAPCDGTTQSYSSSSNGATSYLWTVGAPATISGADDQASVSVNFNGASSVQLCVEGVNNCGSSTQFCETIGVIASPTATISGGGSFCTGSGTTAPIDIALTGTSPWTVTYGVGGSGNTITVYGTDTTINVATGGNYTIGSVSSGSCAGITNGSAQVDENPLSTATLSGSGAICAGSGQTVNLPVTLTGTGNWTLTYAIDAVDQAPVIVTSSPYNIVATQAGTYTLVSVEDANGCTNTGSGTATVTENTEVVVSNIAENCNATGDAFEIVFEITGGDPSTYSVTGGAGSISPSAPYIFTSSPIAAGMGYNFDVSDGAGCNTVNVTAPEVICNCGTAVGTMDQTPISLCGDGAVTAGYDNTGEMQDPNDGLQFILHEGTGLTIVNEIDRSGTPSFSFQGGMVYGQTYYISAVVGTLVGGEVDLSETCTMVAQGTPVVWYEEVIATISGDATICNGGSAQITITLTGSGPYDLQLSNGETFNGIATSPYTFTYTPTTSGTEVLTVTSVTTPNCVGSDAGSATVEMLETLANGIPDVTINATNTGYTVCFDISGGAAPYTVDGNPVAGTQFCSQEIPCGDGYSFELNDAQNCGPVTVAQAQVVCSCSTQAGTVDISTDPVGTCDGGTLSAVYNNDEALDGDDVVDFMLHDGNGTPILTSSTPDFTYQAPLMYDVIYYISPRAGNDDGTGAVDATDPCYSVSPGTPVIWYETPSATLSGDATLCFGETTDLNVALTGPGPFNVTLSNGQNFTGVPGPNLTVPYTPPAVGSETLTITSATNANCDATLAGTATVFYLDNFTTTIPDITFNSTNTAYTVCFDINGGEAPYTVDGTAIAGTQYCSPEIPCGTGFSFEVDDNQNCGPLTVEQQTVVCNCDTQTGDVVVTADLVSTCDDGTLSAVYTGNNETLDGDDVVDFILHNGDGVPILINATPDFSFQAPLMYGVTYFISSRAGNDDGTGSVDGSDPCLSVSPGTAVAWFEAPVATISGVNSICFGGTTDLTIDFTGDGPFDLTLSNGQTFNDVPGPSMTFQVNGDSPGTTNFTITDFNNVNCQGTAAGTASVTVLDELVTSIPDININATSTGYTVCFDISGGQGPYTVDGTAITGSQFCSQEIACGDGFSFEVNDAQNCGPITVEQATVVCTCVTTVGDMVITTDPVSTCDDGTLSGVYDNTNEALDGNDVVDFILHNGDGNALLTNGTPDFGFQAPLFYGVTYFISARAGDDDGTGSADPSDPCYTVSAGTPVVWYEMPEATLSGNETVCGNEQVTFTVFFTGGSVPYDLEYTNNGNPVIVNDVNAASYDIVLSATEDINIVLTGFSDDNCAGTVNGTASLTVIDIPVANNITVTPNATNTSYQVCFDISGGDAASYSVTGMPGTINGTQFCSDPIPCGTIDYDFLLNDANNCAPELVSGQFICNCDTEVGTMALDAIEVCEDQPITASYDDTDQVFDGNDGLMFVLHDNSGNSIGTVFATNDTPDFTYQPGMEYGQTYYISAVVGDMAGGVVDLNDPCLAVAPGTPVVFYVFPVASITGDATICAGESTEIVLGVGAVSGLFELQFADGTSLTVTTDTTLTVSPGVSTDYTLTGIANLNTGCAAALNQTAQVTVNESETVGTALAPLTQCQTAGNTVDLFDLLDGADTGGTWTALQSNPAGGTLNANTGLFTTAGALSGAHVFTYAIDNPEPCADESVTIVVNLLPAPIANAGEDQMVTCDEPEVMLGGSSDTGGEFTYVWTNSAGDTVSTALTYTATMPGIYTLDVTNTTAGCTATDVVEVIANNDTPVPFFSLSDVSCFGNDDGFLFVDSIVGGQGPYVISLDDGPFTQQTTFGNLSGGNYEIVIQDANGCEVTADFDITEPNEILLNLATNFEGQASINWGDSIQLQIQSNYPVDSFSNIEWSPRELINCDSCATNWVSPLETTTFGVFVQVGECTESSLLDIIVRNEIPIFLPNAFSPDGNGDNDVFFVQADPMVVKEVKQFQIHDRWGESHFVAANFPPNDPTYGWNGMSGGKEMNSGVFVWVAEVELLNGRIVTLAGDVAILR